jgi:hypothetical protein
VFDRLFALFAQIPRMVSVFNKLLQKSTGNSFTRKEISNRIGNYEFNLRRNLKGGGNRNEK